MRCVPVAAGSLNRQRDCTVVRRPFIMVTHMLRKGMSLRGAFSPEHGVVVYMIVHNYDIIVFAVIRMHISPMSTVQHTRELRVIRSSQRSSKRGSVIARAHALFVIVIYTCIVVALALHLFGNFRTDTQRHLESFRPLTGARVEGFLKSIILIISHRSYYGRTVGIMTITLPVGRFSSCSK